MTTPVFEDCPADEWTKVAENATVGQIHMITLTPGVYQQTYRDTGGAAPTLESDGVPAFPDSEPLSISSDAPIDVYIWPKGADGRVRVDL